MSGQTTVHKDVRWNPDLEEWFCADCGLTSDHATREDAMEELAVFECSLMGTKVKRITVQERQARQKMRKVEVKDCPYEN